MRVLNKLNRVIRSFSVLRNVVISNNIERTSLIPSTFARATPLSFGNIVNRSFASGEEVSLYIISLI